MRSGNIVIIEDENDLASALKDALEGRGYVVRVALRGEEGLELVKKERPDLILLDLVLPDMTGIDILRELQPMRAEKHIPVIILSNLDNPDDLKEAREYNIEEYLIKTDWKLEDVIARIKEAIK